MNATRLNWTETEPKTIWTAGRFLIVRRDATVCAVSGHRLRCRFQLIDGPMGAGDFETWTLAANRASVLNAAN